MVLPFAFRSLVVSTLDCLFDLLVVTVVTPSVAVLWPVIAVVYFFSEVPYH